MIHNNKMKLNKNQMQMIKFKKKNQLYKMSNIKKMHKAKKRNNNQQ